MGYVHTNLAVDKTSEPIVDIVQFASYTLIQINKRLNLQIFLQI
ncbi:MazG nucleotide pyrophosphohydrolase [Mannheimia varigena USDA-ARS-USMARC-1388]|nr:MazG nucleotide pyrophosphohydrolase [Mannheimia varigena USDA-ARS-USMARC-1388]